MGEYPHSCKVCEVSEAHRQGWGCDAESARPQQDNIARVINAPCAECGGHGRAGCSGCDGSGLVALRRCPVSYLREKPDTVAYLNYFNSVFSSKGLLPAAGGFLDQPAQWCEAMQHLQSEQNRIERERMDRAERKAEMKRNG
jgi:hypothetical protein